MKFLLLLAGLVIGIIIGVILTNQFKSGSQLDNGQKANFQLTDTVKWKWADSLDAVKASPQNHKIIFENKKIRILEVTLKPYEFEQMHTHRFPGVMWGGANDAPQYDIIYYPYAYDSSNHKYFATDSIKESGGGQPDKGHYMKSEGPHRIKNLSNVTIVAYRVEFKTEIKN